MNTEVTLLLICAISSLFNLWAMRGHDIIVDWPVTLWSTWALGAYVAEVRHHGGKAFKRPFVLGVLSAGAFVCCNAYRPLFGLRFAVAAPGFAVLLERMLECKAPLLLVEKWLVNIGLWSYSFYLWHEPLLSMSFETLHKLGFSWTRGVQMSVYAPLILAVFWAAANVLYRVIEFPSIRLGARMAARFETGPLQCRDSHMQPEAHFASAMK